jgi:hypothetical protein
MLEVLLGAEGLGLEACHLTGGSYRLILGPTTAHDPHRGIEAETLGIMDIFLAPGLGPQQSAPPPGRVPRLARLMALAIRFEQLLGEGEVASYAELGRLGHVTRARVS